MKRQFTIPLALSGLVLVGIGCGTATAPKELLTARSSYEAAKNGPAAQLQPAALETARQALGKAEASFEDSAGSAKTKDLSYVAERQAQIAAAKGRRAAAEKSRGEAEAAFIATAGNKLDSKNALLAGAKVEVQKTAAALAAEKVALATEKLAREAAEQRARDALTRLSALAAIKEDTRGTVITLSGSVLFATDKSDLLPKANERLNQVADVLKEQPERTVTVLGFTDSNGSDAHNQELSKRRADSVRAHLISQGVVADQITAVGKGEADPIADNKNPEGRANNRRVEIVLSPVKK